MILSSSVALHRLHASRSSRLPCRNLPLWSAPHARQRHTSPLAAAGGKSTPSITDQRHHSPRQPGPVKRDGLPQWAEYRFGASGTAEAPLAVLCGWLGCRQPYLRKYSSVYNSLGVDTLALSPPVPYTIFPTLADRATEDLLR